MTRPLLILVLLLGCETYGPFHEADRPLAFTPPPAYLAVWHRVTSCLGVTGLRATEPMYHSIHWYSTPAEWWSHEFQRTVYAVATAGTRSITISQTRMTDARTVAHEMVHIIIRRSGHPEVFDRCHLNNDDIGYWGEVDTTGIVR